MVVGVALFMFLILLPDRSGRTGKYTIGKDGIDRIDRIDKIDDSKR